MTRISPLSLDLLKPEWVLEVPSPPHDALSPADRRAHLERFPRSYLGVTRAPEDITAETMTPAELLRLGRESLETLLTDEVFEPAAGPGYFVYRLTTAEHTQTGLVCGVAVSDYDSGQVRIHERTKQDRAQHLARHLEVVGAQSSPIALAADSSIGLADILETTTTEVPDLDFTSPDGLRQEIWVLDGDDTTDVLVDKLDGHPLYLIDGHHRAAAASFHRAAAADYGGLVPSQGDGPTTDPLGADWMLSVIFPIEQLANQAFHRVLPEAANPGLMDKLLARTTAAEPDQVDDRAPSEVPVGYCDDSGQLHWRLLDLPLDTSVEGAPAILANLDVVRFQRQILEPLLDIDETASAGRLEYRAGGSTIAQITSTAEHLIKPGEVVVVMRHVTMDQLMTASDNGLVMPPKSTYFMPKVRSGIFLHRKEHL